MGIDSIREQISQTYHEFLAKGGKILDDNPEVYKLCILGFHFFKAYTMYATMEMSPLPMVVTGALMCSANGLYRVAVERDICAFQFSIPSAVGCLAMWASKVALIQVVTGAIFTSYASALVAAAGLFSLLAYTGWVYYLSNEEIDNYLARKQENTGNQNHCDNHCNQVGTQ